MTHYQPDNKNKRVAEQLLSKTDQPITTELNRLAHQLDTDIRENLPPQMLAVVVGVLKLVEELEGGRDESQ